MLIKEVNRLIGLMITEYLVFVVAVLLVASMLGGFFDADFGSPIPWMALTEPDTWSQFEINLASLEAVEAEVPFGKTYDPSKGKMGEILEASADFRNIHSQSGDEMAEDGNHTVPFWACASLQSIIVDADLKIGKKAYWLTMRYKRTTIMRKGAENSQAHFIIADD